jgi:hypothetical protein
VDAATLFANTENDFKRGKVSNMIQTHRGRAILHGIIAKLCTDFADVISRSTPAFAFLHSCRHYRMCSLTVCVLLCACHQQVSPHVCMYTYVYT